MNHQNSPRFTPESFQNGPWMTKIHSRTISEWFVNHWDSWDLLQNHFRMAHESLKFTPESFQSGLWITKIHPRIISECFVNHWHSSQNHFKVVCKSPRFTEIYPRIISECSLITEIWFVNHWDSSQDNFRVVCESPRFAKIHPRIISEWFVNHWDSQRFVPESFQSGWWITKICIKFRIIAGCLVNHQDSPQNHFRVVCKSLRFAKIHQYSSQNHFRILCESPRFTEIHQDL